MKTLTTPQQNNNYIVKIDIVSYSGERVVVDLVKATSEYEAGIIALKNQCHGEPDFREFPKMDGCFDMGEYVYTVDTVTIIETEYEYLTLSKYL